MHAVGLSRNYSKQMCKSQCSRLTTTIPIPIPRGHHHFSSPFLRPSHCIVILMSSFSLLQQCLFFLLSLEEAPEISRQRPYRYSCIGNVMRSRRLTLNWKIPFSDPANLFCCVLAVRSRATTGKTACFEKKTHKLLPSSLHPMPVVPNSISSYSAPS